LRLRPLHLDLWPLHLRAIKSRLSLWLLALRRSRIETPRLSAASTTSPLWLRRRASAAWPSAATSTVAPALPESC
jgi:hypothetical protein